jgi:uncharacterized membrane protein YbhN (UPF0104 family)
MTTRSLLIVTTSVVAAFVLVIALGDAAKLDPQAIIGSLATVRWDATCGLAGLIAVYVCLGGEKWRLVDRYLGGGDIGHSYYAALSAVGQAVGQVLPVQLALPLTRAVGTWLITSKGGTRSAVGTIIELGFDLMIVVGLALASAVALATGLQLLWPPVAIVASVLTICFAGSTIHRCARNLHRLTLPKHRMFTALQGAAARLVEIDRTVLQKLVILSVVRFLVLWAMACMTSLATGLDVPPLQLAVALPLVVLATVLPLTPAAIGVNEGAFTMFLFAQGTPLVTAIQWSILNRILVCSCSLAVGVAGAAIALSMTLMCPTERYRVPVGT